MVLLPFTDKEDLLRWTGLSKPFFSISQTHYLLNNKNKKV